MSPFRRNGSLLVVPQHVHLAEISLRHQAATGRRPLGPLRTWEPLPYQVPPTDDEWETWILRGGRGSGKTRPMVEYVLAHLESEGRQARVGVGAPTYGAARDVCAEGESGLITMARDRFREYNRSMGEAWHVRGGYVKFQGSEQPDRWNGPQWTLLWWDELALCRRASYDQSMFGLRLGEHPRTVVSTTPKSNKWVHELEQDPTSRVTRGSMFDNPYISAKAKAKLMKKYKGTRLEKRELYGEYQDDVEGALWRVTHFAHKVERETLPPMQCVVVGVDPNVSNRPSMDEGLEEFDHDEVGIIVGGVDYQGQGYVLADYSSFEGPSHWTHTVLRAYDEWEADYIVGEVNNGGDLVEMALAAVWHGPLLQRVGPLPYKKVWASRGKRVRAEPVVMLYDQAEVLHVHGLDELEDQMLTWTPRSAESPGRMDAAVWTLTELLLTAASEQIMSTDEHVSISPY